MKSLSKRQNRLFAVVLAAAGAGVLVGLQPALAGGGNPFVVSRSMDAQAADYSASALIIENGDGTATILLGVNLPDGTLLNAFDWANTNYSISADLRPGQSGRLAGSGTGSFEAEGTIIDWVNGTFTPAGPVAVDLAVADADTVSAYIYQGVSSQNDPLTGEVRILRQHTRGNQAYGNTAGSLSVLLDGNPLIDTTGGWGSVSLYKRHDVERLR